MTTPNHSIQSALVAYFIYPNIYFIIFAMILGVIPDIGRLFQKDKNNWNKFYVPAHNIKNKYLWIIPFWNIHIIEDYFMHNQHYPYGWKSWGIYAEISMDILLIIILLFIFI